MNIDEPVELVAHDPEWFSLFNIEQARLVANIDVVDQQIEHIGSTAVADLIAKPVIDLMVGVSQWPATVDLTNQIKGLGYEFLGQAGVVDRYYFRRRSAHKYNLHLVEFGGSHWTNNIAVREYLCRDSAARKGYAEQKKRAIKSGNTRLLGYSAAKSEFLQKVVRGSAEQ